MKLLILVLCSTFVVFSQKKSKKFDYNTFIKNVRKSYHSFEVDSTIDLKSDLTSLSFDRFIKSKTTDEMPMPVKITWTDVTRITLEKNAMSLDVENFEAYHNQVVLLTNLFLQNWLNYSVNELIPQKALNFNFDKKGQRIFFSYILQEGKKFQRIAREFGLNGLLLKEVIHTDDNKQLLIEPRYRSVEGKWLCVGWFFQKTDENGEVIEGIKVDLVQQQIGKNWYPHDVHLTIQTSGEKGAVTREQLIFRQYTLNGERIN